MSTIAEFRYRDKNKPLNFLRSKQAIDLIELLNSEQLEEGIPAIQSKQGLGTFVSKDLVYAYANVNQPGIPS